MTRTIKMRAIRAALMLGITLGSTGAITAISAPLTASSAHAFGWSDITGALDDFGTAVAGGIAHVADTIVDAGEALGRNAVRIGGDVADGMVHVGGTVVDAGEHFGRNAVRVGSVVGDAVGLDGSFGVSFSPSASGAPAVIRPGQWGQRPYTPGSMKAPPEGVLPDFDKVLRKKDGLARKKAQSRPQDKPLDPGDGTGPVGPRPVPKQRFDTVLQQKGNLALTKAQSSVPTKPLDPGVGTKPVRPVNSVGNHPIGRDKSVWGRPVGVKKPISRDKSVWGRPVGQAKTKTTKSTVKATRVKTAPVSSKRPAKKRVGLSGGSKVKTMRWKPITKKAVRMKSQRSRKSYGGGSETKTKHWRGKVRNKAVPMKMHGNGKAMKRSSTKTNVRMQRGGKRRG